jgi:maltooligosyltrehalose trehalohydrolase
MVMKTIGATYLTNNRCLFSVWAPEKKSMILHIVHPVDQKIPMRKDEWGYFSTQTEGILPGYRYFFRPEDEGDYPDPASHYQPEGVHGPSEVLDHHQYQWHDMSWHGLAIKDLIFYEIHIGTFTREGTFEAIIPLLDEIVSTGINALELMPVSQFSGYRNWGYDGVYPYAVQNSYGGPEGLKKLIDACHTRGIAVFLDVVYNHLGPEGNYLERFGPYFTRHYNVPWGEAINFDGPLSDGVRDYFGNNPVHWSRHYHIDGLRIDAIHMIYDSGAVCFWELVHEKITNSKQQRFPFYTIAESDLNSPRVVKSPEQGGFGFDAQWLDDFHHALYVLLDKEGKERYEDFGQLEQLAKAYTDGFVHSGEYVRFRRRKHGASSAGIPGDKFVVFNQNHDQVGNRVKGERLSVLVDFKHLKLGAAALLLAPYVPMLFMGEEYGEDAPFFYFVSHLDQDLIKAVREGRKKEFEDYKWQTEPPDPQDENTFQHSKIQWKKRTTGNYRTLLEWHKELILLRRTNPALQTFKKDTVHASLCNDQGLLLHRKDENGENHLLCFLNFSDKTMCCRLPAYHSQWLKILDSLEDKWSDEKEVRVKEEVLPIRAKAGQTIEVPGYGVIVFRRSDVGDQ